MTTKTEIETLTGKLVDVSPHFSGMGSDNDGIIASFMADDGSKVCYVGDTEAEALAGLLLEAKGMFTPPIAKLDTPLQLSLRWLRKDIEFMRTIVQGREVEGLLQESMKDGDLSLCNRLLAELTRADAFAAEKGN